MPKGGRLTIAVKKNGENADLAFADTGCGIPPEHLAKIFIPFFTTKSRGTGLGLSIVHGIVKSHGGTLKVESQVGKVARIKQMIGARPIEIEVDGGITPETAPRVVAAGAGVLVAGSAVFKTPDYKANMDAIRKACG